MVEHKWTRAELEQLRLESEAMCDLADMMWSSWWVRDYDGMWFAAEGFVARAETLIPLTAVCLTICLTIAMVFGS